MKAIEVAAGLVFRDGKLLLTQRHPHAHLGGLWEFPGGKREPHETFEQCLVRELREELGIEIEVGQMVESLDHWYSEKLVHLRFFLCEWLGNEPRTLGCAAFTWVTRTELCRYEFPAADRRLLQMLAGRREWWAEG